MSRRSRKTDNTSIIIKEEIEDLDIIFPKSVRSSPRKKKMDLNSGHIIKKSKIHSPPVNGNQDILEDDEKELSPTRAKRARKFSKKKLESMELYFCTECNETFTKMSDFKAHAVIHSKTRTVTSVDVPDLSCDFCGKSFEDETSLAAHKVSQCTLCSICNTEFSSAKKMQKHMKTHEYGNLLEEGLDEADEKVEKIPKKKGIKKKTINKRRVAPDKDHACHLCGLEFVFKSNMLRHMKLHMGGEKPFRCDLCPAAFGQAIDLKRHNISHTGIKPFKCDICDATFSRKNNLKWHKLTHSDDAGFTCNKCSVGFRTAGNLKAHMRAHAPPKPFVCDLCPSSFRKEGSMLRHRMTHTGERPLRMIYKDKEVKAADVPKNQICEVCSKAFAEKRSLRRHIMKCHSELSKLQFVTTGKKESESKLLDDFQVALASKTRSVHHSVPSISLHGFEVVENDEPPQIQFEEGEAQTIFEAVDAFEQELHQGPEPSQIPQILLAAPGKDPKTARPAGQCQNHASHILTMVEGSFNQWQSWCFCDPQNLPGERRSKRGKKDPDNMTRIVVTKRL